MAAHAASANADNSKTVLVTGGAGFIGANLCTLLARRHPGWELIALDNLKRRGSELNLSRLRESGVEFVHGDVRRPEDLAELQGLDAIVECSAEPSVLAGITSAPDYALHTNLGGAYHCLELARRQDAQMVFLSTSRVYPVAALSAVRYVEEATRFTLSADQELPGVSSAGISESFPLTGARTFYGATKLAAELLVEEYASAYGLRSVVDRCGVVAGPWQMGKVDQGVFTYWMVAHTLGNSLRYLGFNGSGKQVRDVLHVADLADLVDDQLCRPDAWAGATVNVGGGDERALSLHETTELCREIAGHTVPVEPSGEERPGDLPIYVSDCARLESYTSWRPRRSSVDVLADIHDWLTEHRRELQTVLV
ncbi:MAG TPA: NAD-dependent epimerase/dehydratase family protein [Gaiellaceae bacterium]